MSLIEKMPSPKGPSPDDRMFILRGRAKDPIFAYDVKDADPFEGAEANNPSQLAQWALENLTPDELSELVALITEGQTTAPQVASDARRVRPSAEAAFLERFPDARRIRNLGVR